VAVADRIVYAKGYGWADRERQVASSPWLEHGLASFSKTMTAAAVMRLVEQGRVQLDSPAWTYVGAFMAAEPADARIKQVTVRQLLMHGWAWTARSRPTRWAPGTPRPAASSTTARTCCATACCA
jgi:CubicO group peptidase (beta-lactamase class C family)